MHAANFTTRELLGFARAIVCQQTKEDGAQYAALWEASAEGNGGGVGVVDPVILRSVGQEVNDPASQCGTHS